MIIRHAVCHWCKRTIRRDGNRWVAEHPNPLLRAEICTENITQLFRPHSASPGTIVDVDTETKEIKWAAESAEIPLPKGQAF